MNDKNKKTKRIEGINDEFQDIALKLDKVDFSKESNKEKVYDTLINSIEKRNIMKKSVLLKRISVACAVILVSGVVASQSTYAKEAISKILNEVSLGHIVVVENSDPEDVPEKHTLYDENGNEVDEETRLKGGTFYTENGDAIKIEGKDRDEDAKKLIVKDKNNINKYTCFNVKLPAYLPKGYEFEQVEFYKDNSGKVENTKYAFLVFVNSETGEKFFISERKDCEETKYEMSTNGKVEKIQINGVDAAMNNNKNVDWIYDGKLCSVMGKSLSRDEVIKVAESIK